MDKSENVIAFGCLLGLAFMFGGFFGSITYIIFFHMAMFLAVLSFFAAVIGSVIVCGLIGVALGAIIGLLA